MARVASIRIHASAGKEHVVWLREKAVIGRRQGDHLYTLVVITESEEVSLDLHDALVSRKHACLFFENEKLFIQDLGSTNGTFLNDAPLPRGSHDHPGTAVPVPSPKAQVKLGARSVLDVEQSESPLGLSSREWSRLSSSLSYRDFGRVFALWNWARELEKALTTPLSPRQIEQWHSEGRELLTAAPALAQEIEEEVRRIGIDLLPDDVLDEREKEPLLVFCRSLPARLSAHFLRH